MKDGTRVRAVGDNSGYWVYKGDIRQGGNVIRYSLPVIALLCFLAVGCSSSSREICPDGEPVFTRSDIEAAFPAYTRQYEVGLNVTSKVLLDSQVGVSYKTKADRLREELNQDNIALQERLKTLVMTSQSSPCDKDLRARIIDFVTDVKSTTKRIPERLNELHDQAATKLLSEVSNLLRYPDTAKDLTKPTVFESYLPNKVPRRLFDLLSAYNDEAILNVPNVGSALRDYKMGYYVFRHNVTALQKALTPRIGELATQRLTTLWPAYFDYAVLRFADYSQAEIMKAFATNEVKPWDDYEQVFIQFSQDKSVAKAFSEAFTVHKILEAAVEKITLDLSKASTTSG